jgi:hypothetical protein
VTELSSLLDAGISARLPELGRVFDDRRLVEFARDAGDERPEQQDAECHAEGDLYQDQAEYGAEDAEAVEGPRPGCRSPQAATIRFQYDWYTRRVPSLTAAATTGT